MSRCIDVMFICNEWGSSKGGLPTFNREFAVNLAKEASSRIRVHCYVCNSSEEDRLDANKQGVNLITARRRPGSNDPMEWLKIHPPELPTPDVVVGHGRKFGSPAYFISERTQCKWIHFVHVFCEDLGKYKLEGRSTPDAIADNEEKNKQELELCEAANLVVAVGSRLQRKYRRNLQDIKVEVITPGIFENFLLTRATHVQPAQADEFSIFMIGRGSTEDFTLKGYDIVGKAVALLGKKFELTFVGSPQHEQRRIEKWFLKETNIARNQLTIRGYRDNKEMRKMLRQADVIVMPSRTEGFGLVALEAISAGVPVLVSSESGIAEALERVQGGVTVVVYSDKPEDWAGRIKQLSEQKPKDRHASAIHLRDKYGEIYSWKKECERFEQMIHGLIQKPHKDAPLNYEVTDDNRALASPSTSESTEADTNQEGDTATGPTVLKLQLPYNDSFCTLNSHLPSQRFMGKMGDIKKEAKEAVVNPLVGQTFTDMSTSMRAFSLSMRSLYVDKDFGTTEVDRKFRKLRDDTRNNAMVYLKGILPLSTKFVASISEYFEYHDALEYGEWCENIADILEESIGYRQLCETLLRMHEDILVPLKMTQHEAKLVITEFKKFGGGLFAVILQSVEHFTEGVKKAAGFFSVMEYEIRNFERKAEKSNENPKKLYYKVINNQAKDMKCICQAFYSILQAVRPDFEAIPTKGTDQNFVDRWLEKQKKVIEERCSVASLAKKLVAAITSTEEAQKKH